MKLDLTDKDWWALELLIERPNLVRPGYFGSLLWPSGSKRARNCSAPLARSAGKVLNRLKKAGCAEWVRPSKDDWGWRATPHGVRLFHEKRERDARRTAAGPMGALVGFVMSDVIDRWARR